MCCRTNDADRPDICRGDGLCQSNYQLDYIWRESCTDGTWTSPECLPLCTGEFFVLASYEQHIPKRVRDTRGQKG